MEAQIVRGEPKTQYKQERGQNATNRRNFLRKLSRETTELEGQRMSKGSFLEGNCPEGKRKRVNLPHEMMTNSCHGGFPYLTSFSSSFHIPNNLQKARPAYHGNPMGVPSS